MVTASSCDTDMSLQALSASPVLALYFSAHWCPPCRQFTPLLARAHAQAKQAGMADKARLNNTPTMTIVIPLGSLAYRWRLCLSAVTGARRT